MLDAIKKKQLNITCEKHKRIDEKFLNLRIKPRIVIFMVDGTNLVKQDRNKHDVAIFENRGPNNVAININKYIAKYDFEIARKLKPDGDERKQEGAEIDDDEEEERDEEQIKQ